MNTYNKCLTKSEFDVVSIDFTNALNLTRINTQAAMNCTSLTGLLDLSHTKITYIGKSTFNGCTNLTGVIFPSSLKYIGDQEGGSVFKDCTDLQFVRVTSKNNDAAFELPDTLESIGYQAFYNCKSLPADTVNTIPSTVTFIGNEAFHKTSGITMIHVLQEDEKSYGKELFKASEYGLHKCITIFQNYETKHTYPNINVSNNKPHTIGVSVSHLLETNEDSPIKVKFEYAGTDVW